MPAATVQTEVPEPSETPESQTPIAAEDMANEVPAAAVQTEVPQPSETPESQTSIAEDMSNDEPIPTEPVLVQEKMHPQSNGIYETGKLEGNLSLGLKASILYANKADEFKVTQYSSTTEGEAFTFVNGYGFVGLVGDLNVYEGWSVEASLEKDVMLDIDMWQFNIGPRYEFRQIGFISPFARAGIVFGRLKWEDDLGSFDTGLGFDAGLGAAFTKSNFRFGLEMSLQRLRFNYNKPADDDIVSTQDYLDMSGIVFSGTITYLF